MGKTLGENFEKIVYIGDLIKKKSIRLLGKRIICKYAFNKNYLSEREPIILKNYANQINKKMYNTDIDVIFSPGTLPIAKIETDKPIVFWTDATFAGMIDFYPEFSNLCKESIRNGNKMEKSALQRCELAIYSSEWAAQTAIQNYGIEKAKVKVVPFGANIICNRTSDDIKNLIENRSHDKCKLLFMGVDWTRKGGNIAIKVTKELNKSGLETELTIVGCKPIIDEPLPSFIKLLGFVSEKEITNLFAESHFLILPSRADCTPIVFCEANSFGVPCLTTNVGGIPTIIKDGLNGKTFSKDADIEEYCKYIFNLFLNYNQYKKLGFSSFNEYQSRLNWSVAGKAVKKLLLESLS
ncbi:MAG: glycosyltransferase family 4 protein [Methanosarcinales archaeon]|nr:glycosyltransferase family 4 protein [Methanosarcinales archaeon]